MALQLDTRQRAMLKAMGVHVWLPGTAFSPPGGVAAVLATASAAAPAALRATPVPTQAPVPRGAAPVTAAAVPAPVTASVTASADPLVAPAPAPVAVPAAAADLDWAALEQAVAGCTACGLCAARKHTTLEPPSAALSGPCDWLVLGDPPDADEDRTGSPFAGSDGVLLANMLAALGLQRVNAAARPETPEAQEMAALPASARAYVTNVVKCRPAHGQIPQAAELAQCAAYLQREIALVQPKMILALGRFAQQLVLSQEPALAQQPLGKLRGTVHRYAGVDVVFSYHPKALMRNSADKGKAWADLCLAADTLAAPR